MTEPAAAPVVVRVYCDASLNGRGRVVELATFEHVDGSWQEARHRLPGAHNGDARVNPFTREVIVRGRACDPECLPYGASYTPGAYPARYTFRCLLCRLNVQITEPGWFAFLDRLAAVRVSAVRLSALARSIGSLA